MRGPCEKSGESEEQEKEVAAEAPAAVRSAGVPEAEDSDTDSDSNLETEGASGQSMPGSLTFGASLAGMEGTGWHQVGRAPCPAEQGAQVGRELRSSGQGALLGTPSAQPVAATPCAFPAMLLGHQTLQLEHAAAE